MSSGNPRRRRVRQRVEQPADSAALAAQPSAESRLTAKVTVISAVITAVIAAVATIAAAVIGGSSQTGGSTAQMAPPIASAAPQGEAEATPRDSAAPITTSITQSVNRCRQAFVVPESTGNTVELGQGTLDWAAVARNAGAIPGQHADIELLVQGTSEAGVAITAIRGVVVGDRQLPVRGTQLRINCGEPMTYRAVTIDLDKQPPTSTSTIIGENDGEGARIEPARFPYRVDVGEPEAFLVSGIVSMYAVDFELEVDWVSEGRSGTVRVDDNGQPFRVTATGNTTATCTWTEAGDLIASASASCPY